MQRWDEKPVVHLLLGCYYSSRLLCCSMGVAGHVAADKRPLLLVLAYLKLFVCTTPVCTLVGPELVTTLLLLKETVSSSRGPFHEGSCSRSCNTTVYLLLLLFGSRCSGFVPKVEPLGHAYLRYLGRYGVQNL